MERQVSLQFLAPYQVGLCEERLPEPEPGHVVVRTILSAISAGTELLVYRGQFPTGLDLDEGLAGYASSFQYPLKYGYSLVGMVTAVGAGVDPTWEGRRVFAFHPHASHFCADPASLHPLPEDITPQQAVFLPNLETAVSLVMDGSPLLGERVVILGQGVVGLLTTTLLARFPLESLLVFDRYPLRRQAAHQAGASAVLDPDDPTALAQAQRLLGTAQPSLADLTFELSGVPQALDAAIALTGFSGRIVVGSWYGQKRAPLDLGGRFHRSRIRLLSSQVSHIDPSLSGRWNKARRFDLVWNMLRQVQPERFITHQFPLEQAAEAYARLDEAPQETLGVILTYPG
jgi:2-desacetyl-2-hydroxyethyl bacteriochlorophyllide A dehydrogenase